jgi:arginine utilization protein RocB
MSMIFSIASDMTFLMLRDNRSDLAEGVTAFPFLAAMFHRPVEQCNAAAGNVINRRCRGWKFQ